MHYNTLSAYTVLLSITHYENIYNAFQVVIFMVNPAYNYNYKARQTHCEYVCNAL